MSTNDPNDTPFGNPNAPDDEVFELDSDQQAALEDSDKAFFVEPGDYMARVVDIEKGASKAGNAMWTWTWAIVSGDSAGKELKLWTALTPKAMFKLRECVEALGVWSPGEKLRVKPREVVGKTAVITVVEEDYNGKPSSKIESVSAPEDGPGARDQTWQLSPTT
jgi:hypothetical protein